MRTKKASLGGSWHFLPSRNRTPIIRQAEHAECGLACLAMVLGHHGKHVSLRNLRSRHDLSSRGVSLHDLIAAAQEHGLHGRPLRLDLHELAELKQPCILHWRMDHFVVLVKVSKASITIHDPAEGKRVVPIQDASRLFTGIALELMPGDEFTQEAAKPDLPLKVVFRMLRNYGPSLRAIFGFSLALEVFALLMPQLVQIIVDQVLANNDHDLLTLVGIGFVLLMLVQVCVGACRSWSMVWLRTHGAMRWTGVVYNHLLRLRQDYFERRHVGDVVSRVDAIHGIHSTLTGQMIGAIMDGVIGVAALAFLLIYSPVLAGVVFAGVLAYLFIRALFYGRSREIGLARIKAESIQRSDLIESIRGVQTIRLNNQMSARSALHANKTATLLNHQVASEKLGIWFEMLSGSLSGLQKIAVLWIGAWLTTRGHMTAGMLMALAAYADQFSSRTIKLVDYLIQLRLLGIQTERVADIVLSPEESHIEGSYQGPAPEASMTLKNVSYRYSSDSPWILRNASLHIQPGESVAMVGPSGSGKTTALRLLLGLDDPIEGSVLMGGIDVASLGKSACRRHIGVVLQDDQLFAGTIADNICFNDPSADMEDIYRSATLAEIHDDIRAMPMGYQTLVGDMGASLSGGQKQRVILARALYRRPSILVLDEATSHLDVELERRIGDRLKQMNVTRIMVAHRPHTIASADRVVWLTNLALEPAQTPP